MIIAKWEWSEGVEIIHVRNQAIVGLPSLPLVIANNSCKMCFDKPSTSAKKNSKHDLSIYFKMTHHVWVVRFTVKVGQK